VPWRSTFAGRRPRAATLTLVFSGTRGVA